MKLRSVMGYRDFGRGVLARPTPAVGPKNSQLYRRYWCAAVRITLAFGAKRHLGALILPPETGPPH